MIEQEDEGDGDSDSSDGDGANEDDGQFAPRFMEDSNKSSPNKSIGDWEKHTKGIGSRLMEKMGYVPGRGLGKEGEGRLEPVQAMVFPPGRSLGKKNFRISVSRCNNLNNVLNNLLYVTH